MKRIEAIIMGGVLGWLGCGTVKAVEADTVMVDTVVSSPLDTVASASFNTPQRLMIDQVVAVIGTKMVKLSDVEKTVESIRMGGTLVNDEVRCQALETMLISNLYALQADEDSITIGENQIEGELEARLAYFTEQIGSREKLEEFYGKSIVQIKEEYRDMVKNAIIARTMENKITEDVRVTPTEVKRFYQMLPKDSIPLVSMQYELSMIVKKPKVSAMEKQMAKERVEALRVRIEKGESFASLAALYSEDPGSRRKGGDLGFGTRGE
ncbi:MAG: peptidylprolyl isomerase, partial [Bacteroidales bacterium]|nr:peptidylprolyl isomerase [Bacteroidales bacterium]